MQHCVRRPWRGRFWSVFALLAVGFSAVVIGCQAGAPDAPGGAPDEDQWNGPDSSERGGAGGDAALGGAGGEGGSAGSSACIPTGDDEPDDDFQDANCDGIDGDLERAIFVAPDGDNVGSGSLDEPLAGLMAALARAQAQNKDIYVCNGAYDEAVVIGAGRVRIYGGYDCADGARRVTDRARFTSKLAVPLRIENATDVVIERIAFTAPDLTTEFGSSFAGVIEKSTGVELRRVELESGQAGPGTAGTDGTTIPGSGSKGADGGVGCEVPPCESGDYGHGGKGTTIVACEGGGSAEPGGFGGDGADTIDSYKAAQPGLPSSGGALPGQVSTKLVLSDGKPGATGAVGAVGGASLRVIGVFAGSTYVANNSGAIGSYGASGHGGGGGAGSASLPISTGACCVPGFGGSQGGYGGCGGRPGHGGSGGGASIALVVVQSEIALTWTRLLAGNGGKGGAGGRGGAAQAGGPGGDVGLFHGTSRVSGQGGPGGAGGRGGSGAPGTGGPSLGLALVDSPLPTMDGVQVLVGSPGFGGDAAPEAHSGPDAPDGLAAHGYDFTADTTITF